MYFNFLKTTSQLSCRSDELEWVLAIGRLEFWITTCNVVTLSILFNFIMAVSFIVKWDDQFNSVESLSRVCLFATPWTVAGQASLSFTISQSLLKLISIALVMTSIHLILYYPLLLLPSILFQHQGLFQWVSSLHQVAKVLEFQLQHQSFQWIFRTDLL